MNQFLDFLERLKTVGLEWYKRFYSVYPAQVIDIKDPEKRGRILFQCPSVFGSNATSPIWAEPCDFRLAGSKHGEFFPPYVGDWVEVMFEHGDTRHPIYKGGFFAQKELPSDFSESYGDVRGWVFKSGQKIVIDETKGKEKITIHNKDGTQLVMDGTSGSEALTLTHKSGAKVMIDHDGNVLLSDKSGNDSIAIKDAEIDVISNGKINIQGKADVLINGKASAEFSGQSGTKVGSSSSVTQIDGTIVNIAGGAQPIALFGSKSLGFGNLGFPVQSVIIQGSTKVFGA